MNSINRQLYYHEDHFMYPKKPYLVKWLDLKYLEKFDYMSFQYLTYEVSSQNEKEAVEIARDCYMRGQKEVLAEELPFLLKLFSVKQKSDF